MRMTEAVGRALVLGPEDGESFWQPVPANGYVRNLLNTAKTGGASRFSMGTQTVAPQCSIREHVHDAHEEVIFVFEGRGIAERWNPATGEGPNRITLYRRAILDYWAENEETLGDIVTHVLIHEIGHHFGLSDDDMERIEAAAE